MTNDVKKNKGGASKACPELYRRNARKHGSPRYVVGAYAAPDNEPCPDLSRVGPIERSQEVVSRLFSENNRA